MEESNASISNSKSKRPSPPVKITGYVGDTFVQLSYSSPAVKGRPIWGKLIPYGKVWRTGANEANVFQTSTDININGETLEAGKYALFTIPGDETWSVIFNTAFDQWGAYDYDSAKNALVVQITPKQTENHFELMRFVIDNEGFLTFNWENLEWSLAMENISD